MALLDSILGSLGSSPIMSSIFGSPMSNALQSNPSLHGISPSMVTGINDPSNAGSFMNPHHSMMSLPNILNPSTVPGGIAQGMFGGGRGRMGLMDLIRMMVMPGGGMGGGMGGP